MPSNLKTIQRRKYLTDSQVVSLFNEFSLPDDERKTRSELASEFEVGYNTIVYWEKEYKIGRTIVPNLSN